VAERSVSLPASLAAALAYAARGWPVLPCNPRDKRPLVPRDIVDGKPVPKSGGLAKASCDPATIEGWWRRWPNALIGIATGRSGFFVLDFDPRVDSDTGEEWTLDRLKGELIEQMGCALAVSLAVRTPSGGVHVYFRQPPEDPIRNSGAFPQHIDVRGDGGHVIVPPGRTPPAGATAGCAMTMRPRLPMLPTLCWQS
jgi:putative DNA primase/helicase